MSQKKKKIIIFHQDCNDCLKELCFTEQQPKKVSVNWELTFILDIVDKDKPKLLQQQNTKISISYSVSIRNTGTLEQPIWN